MARSDEDQMQTMDDRRMRQRIEEGLARLDARLWLRRAAVLAALSGAGGLAGAADGDAGIKSNTEDAALDAGEASDASSGDLPLSVAIYSAPIDPGCGGS